jgi:hypothetical protein
MKDLLSAEVEDGAMGQVAAGTSDVNNGSGEHDEPGDTREMRREAVPSNGPDLPDVHCPACAAPLTSGDQFCGRCGQRLDDAAPEPADGVGTTQERPAIPVGALAPVTSAPAARVGGTPQTGSYGLRKVILAMLITGLLSVAASVALSSTVFSHTWASLGAFRAVHEFMLARSRPPHRGAIAVGSIS